MKNNKILFSVKLLIIAVLIAAMALCMISCGSDKKNDETNSVPTSAVSDAATESATEQDSQTDAKISITVEVKGPDEKTETFTISTDADNLGDALVNEGLVQGEESEYGLYIKTVNGITADYDTDGSYWALYKGGEYLTTGADSTPISNGDSFEIVYTKS